YHRCYVNSHLELWTSHSYPRFTPLSRSFSSSLAQQRDKSASEDKEEHEEGTEREPNREEPLKPEEPAESKGKSSETPTPIPSASGPADSKPSGSSTGGAASGGGDGGRKGRKSSTEKALQKPAIPDVYPQVMAIPIARRPLFPGFYKAITIR